MSQLEPLFCSEHAIMGKQLQINSVYISVTTKQKRGQHESILRYCSLDIMTCSTISATFTSRHTKANRDILTEIQDIILLM